MRTRYKQRSPKKHVGAYSPRSDGYEKARGTAEFLDDIALKSRNPGLLYAKVLRSPYAHARITSLDTSKAEALPGVFAVLTFSDPEIVALKPSAGGWTPFYTCSYDRMLWSNCKDRLVLSNTVRWVGDEAGVVVAAETPEIAEQALDLLDIKWEILPFVLEPKDAIKTGAPILHPEINPNSNVQPPSPDKNDHIFMEHGNVEKAFAEAEVIADVHCEYNNTDHGCLGTRGCLMKWDGDKLTCWTSYFMADQLRMYIKEMLDIPLHKIRVINPYIGGSFGRGNVSEQPFFIFTAILAKRTGHPVLFQHTRREDFHDTRNRILYDCRLSAMKDGTITGVQINSICDSGAYSDHSLAASDFVVREWAEGVICNIPNIKLETRAVYTNKIPGGVKRGIGHNQVNFAFCYALDDLAEKLNMDPVELAIKNLGYENFPLPNPSLEAVVREGAKRIDWHRRLKPGEGLTFDGVKKRGLGFSFHCGWHAAWQEAPRGHIQVSIRLNPDGSVILDAPTAETGPGSNVCNVLACAEALNPLGITPKDITWISQTDTERGLKDQVQTDSGVSYVQAEMMSKAAIQVKNQVTALAAEKFNVEFDDVEIHDGKVFARSTEEEMTVKELLWSGDLVPILAMVSELLPDEMTGVPYLATFAEVEVDTELGSVDVLKLVVVNDLGTVMYASGAEGQQMGGQAMSLGEALTEEIILDPNTGAPLDFNWIDYKIPTMLDYPDVEPVLMEVWKGAGEFGACGMGESVTCCAPRAVANAIYNAVGVRVNSLPMTPEKVLQALGKISSSSPGKAG